MTTVKDILNSLENVAPCTFKMDFDNVGLLAGNSRKEVHKILLALEVTHDVIDEAKEMGAELIVAHHPILFSVKNVSTEDLVGNILVHLLESGISAICMHTNLDSADGGVNDTLAHILGIQVEGVIDVQGRYPDGRAYGLGRFGTIEQTELEQFLPHCKDALHCNGLRYISAGKPVQKLAVCGGSGSSLLQEVAALGCDTFVTGDVKHNGFLDAYDLGINLIDAGHYSTENVIMPVLETYIKNAFPMLDVKISERHKQPEQFYV